ncbi:HlyD family type I secretion periplasmic adaptor subunit [Rhizobium grahamii]|uniref:Membrane fusion protein (MFP) family protein n=1 Tax=Rhizobium grahamii TaxID=1120045 RepID=A0A370KFQ1_9HYPH|nr:HlyD family type I secretion periplasmic adaptor subunit [Rhizobium grahamii]RDJ03271.1 hemolysin secretion protein D [Rhizobium grahamii]
MTRERVSQSEYSMRRLSVLVLGTIALLVGVMGGLAATTEISGAVIAPGSLVVDSYVKSVQHLKGGIVGDLRVKNGDRVDAGQVLIHLDDTQTIANLAIIRKRLDELSARTARLLAERDHAPLITFPTELLARAGEDDVARTMAGERQLFDDRMASRQSRKSQLRERIQQLNQEAGGLAAQETGKRTEIDLINKELSSLQGLFDRGILPAAKVYALRREGASLTGELGNLVSSIAQAKGKMTETELQITQIDDDQSAEVSDQLRQAQSDSGEFMERLAAAQDDLERVDIRSPQAGIVDHLSVHARGAVISPGDSIMQIVPDQDALVAELKLSPQDIDQVSIGQPVMLRFSAFNQRDTPQLNAQVVKISAELTVDQNAGASYYLLRASISKDEWQRLGKLTAVSGMPVEAFLQTGERTVLAYLVKPMTDQMARTFREE